MRRALWVIVAALCVATFTCALGAVWLPEFSERLAQTAGITGFSAFVLTFPAIAVSAGSRY